VQLDVHRTVTAKDVHLTSQGYESLALGLVKEASNFFEGKMKGKHVGKQKICEAEWRGFVSRRGISRTNQKTIKKSNYGARSHSYKPSNRKKSF
jgi:hypothetical protein